MPEILLFGILEPQSGDGMSTGGGTPPFKGAIIVLPQEHFEKKTQKKASPVCNFRHVFFVFSIPIYSCALL